MTQVALGKERRRELRPGTEIAPVISGPQRPGVFKGGPLSSSLSH